MVKQVSNRDIIDQIELIELKHPDIAAVIFNKPQQKKKQPPQPQKQQQETKK